MFTSILHNAPYTTEWSWNGLRFAEKTLDGGMPVRVFLFSDAVYVARRGHGPPEGILNVEDLLIRLLVKAQRSACVRPVSTPDRISHRIRQGAASFTRKTVDMTSPTWYPA